MVSYEIIPATATCSARVGVGVSPAGIEWNVYPGDGELPAQLGLRVAYTATRLRMVKDKHERTQVTVRKLTSNGTWHIEDAAHLFEGELKADYEAMTSGATFVRASRRLLREVADDLEQRVDDYAEGVAEGVNTDDHTKTEFAERSARRSVATIVRRIRAAL